MRAYHENMRHDEIPFRATFGKGFHFLSHWHTEIEMIYVINGSYRIGINDDSQVLNEGEFAIVCSDDIHYYDSQQHSEHIMLIIRPDIIGCFGGWPQDVRFKTSFITQEILKGTLADVVARIDRIFRILPLELAEKKPHYESYIKGLLYELSSLMLRHLPTIPLNKKEKSKRLAKTKTLQYVLEFLEENYMNDINLDDIATHIHISPFHLSRIFRGITGMNFKLFLNNYRLEKAEQLLQNTTDSVTEIAMRCGFGSVRTFNRIYKTNRGCTPTSIR